MKDRRTFLKAAMCMGVAPMALAAPQPPMEKKRKMKLIKPKRLKKGQTIGLIAPASSTWENGEIHFAKDIIKSLGFKVKEGKHLFDRNDYLAGEDQQRADDVNRMFADEEVHGIMALRGGFGTPRILPLLDYDLIAKNPKVLLGYSDITALHTAIHKHTGLVTFHGPIAKQTFTPYTLEEFKKVLMEPQAPMIIGSPPPFEGGEGLAEYKNRLLRIQGGKAQGPLIGGNLSLLTKLMGTPYEPDFKGRILVLEDVGEEPYRIDGMLTHLWLTGKLGQLAGLLIGKFTDCKPTRPGPSRSMETIFNDRFKPLGIPVLAGLMIGHISNQTTFPIGVQAELDADAGTLTLLETGVL